jgi:hypothetical protein
MDAWKMKINNKRGTNSYPKIKLENQSLVWQALLFRKEVASAAFQKEKGETPKRICKCVQQNK